ncbi:Hypothetical protein SCF082_LOCUS4631, partial [Durusdinium trenchii]
MRILVFQTPKLTYVQTLEFLLRETSEQKVDLAILPEFALEHPAQCSNQSELSYDNVSIMMLSRVAKHRQMFVVLGSVEERQPTGVFDTCVVFNRSGEIILQYRKHGSDRNSFETEYGTVGVLLGAEVEDERWSTLLALSPSLILNPCNAPMELDTALAKAHPELQVAAWHKGFRRTEASVQSRLRTVSGHGGPGCVFIRSDAPLRQGGAGLSMLVEANRSVLAPSWGACFFLLEIGVGARKLPKWRTLTVDELIKAASQDREILKCDTVEVGPRYRVWTLRTPTLAKAAMIQRAEWSSLWLEPETEALPAKLVHLSSCFLWPILTRDGRQVYVVAESSPPIITLWDLRHRREWQSFESDAFAEITALGAGPTYAQFAVAGHTEAGLLIQLYEEKRLIQDFSIAWEDFPFNEWRVFPELLLERGDEDEHIGIKRDDLEFHRAETSNFFRFDTEDDEEKVFQERSVKIRRIFWNSPLQVVAIADSENLEKPEVLLLLDLDNGSLKIVDIYCDGPPKLDIIPEHVETVESVSLPTGTTNTTTDEVQSEASAELDEASTERNRKIDKIISVMAFEKQKFPELRNLQSGLVCLWRSDRLCIVTYGDWRVYDQILVEREKHEKERWTDRDIPLCASILPEPSSTTSGGCSLLASYASMIIRWWRVSLKSCFQQACVVLSSPVYSLSLLSCDGPTTSLAARSLESSRMVAFGSTSEKNTRTSSIGTHSQRGSQLHSQSLQGRIQGSLNSRLSISDPKVTTSLEGLAESPATIL